MGVWEEKRKMVFWSPFVLLSTADLALQCFLYQLAACPHRKGRGNDDLQLPKTALQLVVDARHPRSHSVAETFLLLSREKIDPKRRNVILSHQFYTAGQSAPETCDSEAAVAMAGGLDKIDVSVLDAFDYAALGHLHGSQRVGRESVRYCGTPYKYSVSEERHHKAVTVVELGEKGEEPRLYFLPLSGLQDVRRLRGTLEEVLAAASGVCHDFVSVTITDEQEPYRIRERLEERYDHLLELRVDNARTRARLAESGTENDPAPDPMEAFRQFYETVNHTPLPEEGERIMKGLIREIQEKGMEGAL